MNPEVPATSADSARTPRRRVDGSGGDDRGDARRPAGPRWLVPSPAGCERVAEKGETPTARGARTRRRIAESVLDVLREQGRAPTAKEVASRAGVSVRLVFHHFDDMDALYRAAMSMQMERHWRGLRAVPSDLPLDQRIARTTAQRAKLFDATSAVRRTAVLLATRHADVAHALTTSNTFLRSWLEVTFSSELEAAGRARGDLLAAIEVATSWEVWERLRREQGLSSAAARRVLVRTLHALLDG